MNKNRNVLAAILAASTFMTTTAAPFHTVNVLAAETKQEIVETIEYAAKGSSKEGLEIPFGTTAGVTKVLTFATTQDVEKESISFETETKGLATATTAGVTKTVMTLSSGNAEQDSLPEGSLDWEKFLIADVSGSMNIRKKASQNSEVVGKLRKGDLASIIRKLDDWYEIESGNVHGFVHADYVKAGEEAKEAGSQYVSERVISTTDSLRVRSGAGEDSGVVSVLEEGASLETADVENEEDGWTAVNVGGETAYVSSDYVKVEPTYSEAVTLEEEAALEEAAKAEAEAKAKAEAEAKEEAAHSDAVNASEVAASSAVQPVNDDVVTASADAAASGQVTVSKDNVSSVEVEEAAEGEEDEVSAAEASSIQVLDAAAETQAPQTDSSDIAVLAAIAQHEAGGQSYEGCLAVASVVVNRMKSSRFPSTVEDVVYQRNQFMSRGALAPFIRRGTTETAKQAARDALAGKDNTGGCLSFRAAYTGHSGKNIGGNVFF